MKINYLFLVLLALFVPRTIEAQIIAKDSSQIAEIEEVVVKGKPKAIEIDKGKIVFNIQENPQNVGKTALDVLKTLPGISVDQSEAILFRGSAGVNVMIDGKMSYLSSSQLTNYLKGLSAEDLSKIELITAPSSEFDAAGNAGIINIISKKNKAQGYAVDIRTSISKGKLWGNNQNISSSFVGKTWDISAMLDYNTPITVTNNKSGVTLPDPIQPQLLRRSNNSVWKSKFYSWKIGTSWQFTPKQKINLAYHGYLDDYLSVTKSNVNLLDLSNKPQSIIRSNNNIKEPYHYDALHLSYLYQLDSIGKKITADVDYTSYRNFSDGLLISDYYDGDLNFQNQNQLRSHQPGFIKIKSAKVDAFLPYDKFTLKAGIKFAEVENDNKFQFERLEEGNFIEIPEQSNQFKYRESVTAAYVSASKKFDKTLLLVGVRVEQTDAHSTISDGSVNNHYHYFRWFPSISAEHQFENNNKLSLAVSRRINRPNYSDLNPVRWYTDEYFYFSGNPELVPEMSWQSSISYSLKNKYIFDLSYNYSNHFISRKLSLDNNGKSIRTQSANFGNRNRIDFTASAPLHLLSFWQIQLFGDLNYTNYQISQKNGNLQVGLWGFTGTLQQDFSLPAGIKFNLAANFSSSELRGIYKTKATGFVDLGVKKSFLDNQLDAGFSVKDLFNTNRYKATSLTDIADYFYNDKPFGPTFTLSLKYHFGGKLIKSESTKTEEQQRL